MGGAAIQPAAPVAHGAGERPPHVAEQLGLDERGRQRGQVDRSPDALGRLGEGLGARVEPDVARQRDGPCDQLLAAARRAGDQGGDVAHPVEERPLPAAQVVGEDRLPDLGPQLGRRHRAAQDEVEDVVERPADLEEAGEHVLGPVAAGHPMAGRLQQLPEVLGELRPAPDRLPPPPGLADAEVVQRAIHASIQRKQAEVLVQPQLPPVDLDPWLVQPPAGAQGVVPRQLPQPDQVGPLREGVVGGPLRRPDHRGGVELPPERLALCLDARRQEWVDVREPRRRAGELDVTGGEQPHDIHCIQPVHWMYISATHVALGACVTH